MGWARTTMIASARTRVACLALAFCFLGTLTTQQATAQQASFAHPDGTTHWYVAVAVPNGITWLDAHRQAAVRGGYLATIQSAAEGAVVLGAVDAPGFWLRASAAMLGPWIGAVQEDTSVEPAGGWVWAEIGSMSYRHWAPGQPDNDAGANRACLGAASGRDATWYDVHEQTLLRSFVIEYSGTSAVKTVGLLLDMPGASDGYTLLSPLANKSTFLLDARGREVHRWQSDYRPGVASYLLENGNLLRAGRVFNLAFLNAGGDGGIVEQFNWEGQKVWEFAYSTPDYVQHHDIERLPNGNILMLVWEKISKDAAIAAGRKATLLVDDELWPEKIVEVQPTGTNTGRIVWEWRTWDHLIQDHDATKPHFGDVAKRPERIDLNFTARGVADWMHCNSIAYNTKHDHILISVRSFNEIWIIDHSTTTLEAAGSRGGLSGKGGDLLYRWGNPLAYQSGTAADQKLFKQHDARWIPDGLRGAGNLLIFNNGLGRPGGDASSVDELVLPGVDGRGNYRKSGNTWGPVAPVWTWSATNPSSFYSAFVSGAQRLQNGATRVCGGWLGLIFEVSQDNRRTWAYSNPVREHVEAMQQGDVPVSNWVFRAPFYAPDYQGLRGRKLSPSGPLERQDSALLVDGSTTSRIINVGDSADFSLRARSYPGHYYLMLTSASPALTPIGYRFMRMGWDDVALISATRAMPRVFVNYFNELDSNGNATARLVLPQIPELAGVTFYNSFLVFDWSAVKTIGLISNTVKVHVVK